VSVGLRRKSSGKVNQPANRSTDGAVRSGRPIVVLIAVVICFGCLAAGVLALTPPWEANDEPDHFANVEQIVGGHMYHITRYNDGHLETIQAPLYYMVLAGFQVVAGVAKQPINLAFAPVADNQQHGNYLHNIPPDGMDQRLLDLLRLPGLLLGVLTIAFTYLATRRLTRDRWTPVVAAAIVAGVPKFVFVSGVLNNDNLSNALGGAGMAGALALLAHPPARPRARALAAAGLGLLAGALVLTKVTGALLAPGLLLAVLLAAPSRRERGIGLVAFGAAALAVCGWWLVYNQIHYGDPLALHQAYIHQRAVLPAVFDIPSAPQQMLVEVPKRIFSSFWYDSGWNQFVWRWYWYLPFWALTAVGVAGLMWKRPGAPAGPRGGVLVCVVLALGGLASIWSLGVQANTEEGRLAFMALPAIAALIALGYERLRLWPASRFALPVIGLIGTLAAIRFDVIAPYFPH
jgi:hypothetical protein